MKKTKVVFIIFLVIVISMIFSGISCAHTIELDPKSLISMPSWIYGDSGSITIGDEKDYTLYYQAIAIPSDIYSQMEKARDDGEAKSNKLKDEYDKLQNELKNLDTEYKAAKKAYEDAKDANAAETEIEKLKAAYETATTNYNNKVKESNAKIKEYNESLKETNNRIKELTPTYVDSNWEKTTDGKFKVDLTKFSGDQAFIVWAKLVTTSGNTYYDENIYMMSGTKPKEVKVTGVTLGKKEITITEGSEFILTATIAPTDATNKVVDWTSDNEKVATVSNGKITAKSVGSATITVTTKDGEYKATAKVTVTAKKTDSSNDETIAQTKTLPRTGLFSIVGILAVIVGIVAIILYRRYEYINIK